MDNMRIYSEGHPLREAEDLVESLRKDILEHQQCGEAMTTAEKIELVTNAVKKFLLAKNKNYGDSVTKPLKIFCKDRATNSIESRLDDKLSRVQNSDVLRKNDVVDIIGYLILKCIEMEWFDFMDFVD